VEKPYFFVQAGLWHFPPEVWSYLPGKRNILEALRQMARDGLPVDWMAVKEWKHFTSPEDLE
jgi:hypothetical protein